MQIRQDATDLESVSRRYGYAISNASTSIRAIQPRLLEIRRLADQGVLTDLSAARMISSEVLVPSSAARAMRLASAGL